MSKRTSIYIGDDLAHAAGPLSDLLGGESAGINAVAGRYRAMLRASLPELTFDEWEALCDANNGCWNAAFSREIPTLQLVDDETAAKHQIDAAALNAVIARLDLPARLGVIDVVERAWAHDGPPLESLRAALKEKE